MKAQADREELRGYEARIAPHENYNFEAIFQIPATHYLHLVMSRSRGGTAGAVLWDHEEYDANGLLAARYESFAELDRAGIRRSGWRKIDSAGRIVEEAEWLG